MARNKKQGDKYNAPFAVSLRKLLDDRNATQGDIAAVTGLTRQTVSQYCNGISEPGYETLVKIADFFDVSTDYLLGRTGDPNRQASAIDVLGLSPAAVQKLNSKSAGNNAEDFINGINIILTMPRIRLLAERINRFTHKIEIENNYNEQNSDLALKLENEITESLPHLKGRLEIYIGKAALQNEMDFIIDIFRGDLDIATGYFECIHGPTNEKEFG